MTSTVETGIQTKSWHRCCLCKGHTFKSPAEFCRHLRDYHCSKEGGSFMCKYGANNICPSLPLEGVSDRDYENHIVKDHVHMKRRTDTIHGQKNPTTDFSHDTESTEPSVVKDQHKWTVYKSTVNLPAVLNDPSRLKRETDFFTKTLGQDFYYTPDIPPSPYLPEIDRSVFDRYKHRISKRYRRYIRSITQPDQNSSQSESSFHQAEKSREELQQIPKLYMLQNFDIENPDTFNAVFPWSHVEEGNKKPDGNSSPKSNKLLQEKLSHYLDIIEVHIAKQISTKSDAFFKAISSHELLQDDMLHTCQAIKKLRDRVHAVDEILAKGSLKIMKLSHVRANHVKLYNKLKMMSTVHQTQPTIQLLLSTNEFVGALDLISTTQDVLSQELAGIHSFRHLGSQLAELEKVIDRMLQEDFAKCVSCDLNRPVSELEPLMEEERIVSLVFGMLRKSRFNFVDVYREEAFTAIRATVKQTVVEAVSEAETTDTDENVTRYTFHDIICDVVGIAAGKTKAPSPVNSPVTDLARPLEEATHLHVSVSEDISESDMMISDEDFVNIQGSLNEMMCSSCDHAHDRCVKVVVARSKDGFLERLSSSEFLSLSREVEKFVADCEEVCGRRSTSLRCSLQSQEPVSYVITFTTLYKSLSDCEKRSLSTIKENAGLILDNERWKQADVPTEFQDLVDHISKTGQLLCLEKVIDSERKPGEYLNVDGQSYAVVGTVLLLLKMMVEYCQCVNDIPSAASDLLNRLVELLKIFNSRTCQLVLGAGALQLVALASRCLQLVVYYIPKVRQHFEEKLMSKNKSMLKHIDQVLKWEVKAPVPSTCFRNVCKQISKMHEAVIDILPLDQIQDLFTKINKSFTQIVRKQLIRLEVSSNGGPQHGLVTSDLAFYSGTFKTLRGLEQLAGDMNDVWS
ncbi:hypothetical protein KUTeg_014048 [Tegillarca granosa]|uniref:Vacuolar protein sorting-associated protein 54 n=1 Tax=Tegillarca granosa TaxID=220873 RepID=A0ABQ9EVH2_TEGGR|nr:hypothetical protein KUTeg_014048 [Tegillarca granosa]